MPEPRPAPAYTLRPATAEDYAFLYDLHVATMKEYVAQTWGWDDAVQQRDVPRKLHPGSGAGS